MITKHTGWLLNRVKGVPTSFGFPFVIASCPTPHSSGMHPRKRKEFLRASHTHGAMEVRVRAQCAFKILPRLSTAATAAIKREDMEPYVPNYIALIHNLLTSTSLVS